MGFTSIHAPNSSSESEGLIGRRLHAWAEKTGNLFKCLTAVACTTSGKYLTLAAITSNAVRLLFIRVRANIFSYAAGNDFMTLIPIYRPIDFFRTESNRG